MNKKQNSNSSAGADVDSSTTAQVTTSSHNSSKPLVSCCLSRSGRRNRTCEDLGIKNKGGMLDLFDNAIKEIYRITDDEYDYLCENLTDGEMSLFVAEKLTFGEKKQCLSIVENHLANYTVSKGSVQRTGLCAVLFKCKIENMKKNNIQKMPKARQDGNGTKPHVRRRAAKLETMKLFKGTVECYPNSCYIEVLLIVANSKEEAHKMIVNERKDKYNKKPSVKYLYAGLQEVKLDLSKPSILKVGQGQADSDREW